jgi:hypothetical protein
MIIDLRAEFDPDDVPDEWWLERLRLRRDRLLFASDWTQTTDDPTGRRDEWATYRQALRDAPATWTPAPTWDAPEPPGGV